MGKPGLELLQKRLNRALKVGGNTHTVADLAQFAQQGRLQAFQNGETCVLTEIIAYPQFRVLNIFMVIGTMDEAFAMLPRVIEHAKSMGCVKIVASGRPGWEPFVKKIGFKRTPRVVYEMDLKE